MNKLQGPRWRAHLAWMLAAACVLALAGLILAAVAAHQIGQWRQSESATRGQLQVQALADRVQHALNLGIPLQRLEGVDAMFVQRLRENPDIQALALTQARAFDGAALWLKTRADLTDASSASPARSLPAGPQSVAQLTVEGQWVADLVLVRHEELIWPLLLAWGGPLMGLVLLGSLLATWGAAHSLARGWFRRRDWLLQHLQAAAQGQYGSVLSLYAAGLRAREFDPRPTWLLAQFRQVNEDYLRLRRLALSLRQTEPDAGRRALLDGVLQRATGDDRFMDFDAGATSMAAESAGRSRAVMPLKTRLALLVLLGVLALWSVFAVLLWERSGQVTQRYHQSLLQAQQLAFNKQQTEVVATLSAGLDRLLRHADWAQEWRRPGQDGLGRVVDAWLQEGAGAGGARLPAGVRLDVFNDRRDLVFSSSQELTPQPLVDRGQLGLALNWDQTLPAGFAMSSGRLYLVVVRRVDDGERIGAVAMGLDAAQLLPTLGQALEAQAFLLNLRGVELTGTQPGLVAREALALPVREALVERQDGASGTAWLAILQPVLGPDRRQAAALLTLRDVGADRAADRRLVAGVLAVGLACLVGLVAGLFVYLRHAMLPLERSVAVLGQLARGNLGMALDGNEGARDDEAGRIAQGVNALRGEMLNLQMLRDERTRSRQQQERLIRNQLKQLAGSLDEQSRVEILRALEPDGAERDASPPQGEHELADLASILGRMSGLVTDQQARLIRLLKELQAAMEQKALLASLQQELEIARRMQLSILPREAPATKAVNLASIMIPAKEVGGDFYDYFMLDDTHLAVVVADVSGKGVPAAFFMAISRTLLKTNALFLRQPAQAIAQLNDQLCAENEQMMFVTAFFGVLDLSSGQLTYVNAGHNPPVWRRGESVSLLPAGQNMALAVMDGLPFVEGVLQLAVGDDLLLYTDGVTEATSPESTLFGEARLLQVVQSASGPVADLPPMLLRALREFENGAPQADDITCVALQFKGLS